MKKVLALILALAMVLSFAACTKKGGDDAGKQPEQEAAKWPNGTVTLLAGYEVGSLTDVNIRTIADWITKETGATVEVKNDAVGGGANLAVELTKAEPDGQTLMLIGANCISNYYAGTWTVDVTDSSKMKIVCGMIQPLPYSGCMVLTQGDAPYNNFEELKAYIEAHPGEVTAASIPGKVMDPKLKSLMIQTGLVDKVRWVSTTSKDGNVGLLNGTINLVMADEASAAKNFLPDTEHPVKAVINLRPDDDFSYYPADTANLDMIKAVPTLAQVLGSEEAEKINIPNTSVWVAPAGTPDEICKLIAECIDKIDNEAASTDDASFYKRCRTNGGTSKYYTWPGAEIEAEYKRIAPILKTVNDMNANL